MPLRAALPLFVATVALATCAAAETPASPDGGRVPLPGFDSARTLVLGISIDRAQARLLAFTLKDRPFHAETVPSPARGRRDSRIAQAEVVLLGPGDLALTRRVDVGALCLDHGPETEPHVEGDTILLHRDTFLVELPELPGFDRVEVAVHERDHGELQRRALGRMHLDRAAFVPAAGPYSYADLAFADAPDDPPATLALSGDVIWPEDVGDPDIYRTYGDPGEQGQRIHLVFVPDGYRYDQKALLQEQFNMLVQFFRWKTPFAEHDRFFNYTLIYAYSPQSGTDQCDCDVTRDTAMGTGFSRQGYECRLNPCLYYSVDCDEDLIQNIVAAELRAPAHDVTLLMVNTTRMAGCAGTRAVFSFGNSLGPAIAAHELGHTMAWLADEYGGDPGCGTRANEINTSLVPYYGAWPEWVPEIGPAWEGGYYYDQCVYRPTELCAMRDSLRPFCPVCNQHWARVIFGHWRVNPTAPVADSGPPSPGTAFTGVPTHFWVQTRLASGPSVTNEFEWRVQGPQDPEPRVVAGGKPELSYTFDEPGRHTVTCRVVADTNFIKPVKYDANVDETAWVVDVETLAAPPEVSAPGSASPLVFADSESLDWEDASELGASSYNLYRGDLTAVAAGDYGACEQAGLEVNGTDADQTPPPGAVWFYLAAGQNPAGEGPLGRDSQDRPRLAGTPCE